MALRRMVLPVTLSMALIFYSFIPAFTPKAHANPFAVAAGVEIGAGALSAMLYGVAAVAAGVGLGTYAPDLKETADNLWSSANQAVKDSLKASIDAAAAAGSYVVNLSSDVVNWLQSHRADLGAAAYPVDQQTQYINQTYRDASPTTGSYNASTNGGSITYSSAYSGWSRSGGSSVTFTFSSTGKYIFFDTVSRKAGYVVVIYANGSSNSNALNSIQSSYSFDNVSTGSLPFSNSPKYTYAELDTISTPEQAASLVSSGIRVMDKAQLANMINQYNAAKTYVPATNADGTLNMSLPIDAITSTSYPLPTIGVTSTGAKAAAIPIGGVTTSAIGSSAAVVNPVQTGTQTGTQAGTGTVSIDMTGVNNINDYLKGKPTDSQSSIDFSPLVLAGQAVTGKFPFSIPWDVSKQLSVFNVSPTTPVFNVDVPIDYGGYHDEMKFNIDFHFLDPIAAVARWFLTIAFDIAIMLGIRRLMPE